MYTYPGACWEIQGLNSAHDNNLAPENGGDCNTKTHDWEYTQHWSFTATFAISWSWIKLIDLPGFAETKVVLIMDLKRSFHEWTVPYHVDLLPQSYLFSVISAPNFSLQHWCVLRMHKTAEICFELRQLCRFVPSENLDYGIPTFLSCMQHNTAGLQTAVGTDMWQLRATKFLLIKQNFVTYNGQSLEILPCLLWKNR